MLFIYGAFLVWAFNPLKSRGVNWLHALCHPWSRSNLHF